MVSVWLVGEGLGAWPPPVICLPVNLTVSEPGRYVLRASACAR